MSSVYYAYMLECVSAANLWHDNRKTNHLLPRHNGPTRSSRVTRTRDTVHSNAVRLRHPSPPQPRRELTRHRGEISRWGCVCGYVCGCVSRRGHGCSLRLCGSCGGMTEYIHADLRHHHPLPPCAHTSTEQTHDVEGQSRHKRMLSSPKMSLQTASCAEDEGITSVTPSTAEALD